MLHKTVKAAATTTDQGQFTAIAAAYTVDRANEQIQRGAFKATIERWQTSEKMIPLHWDHSGDPENIIGTVDPKSMRESDEGLYVRGQLDLDNSEVAREAWRLMKSNSVAFSFGYLVGSEEKNADGVLELKDIDLFEVSVTPAPMNPDTRILDMKSVNANNAYFQTGFVAPQTSGGTWTTDSTSGGTWTTDSTSGGTWTTDSTTFAIQHPSTNPESSETPDEKSVPDEVETVEADPPATKDPLRNQIDRELIEIALGR